MSSKAVLQAERPTDGREPVAGTGECTVAECGCTGFVESTPDYCQGKNSANGTCGHTKAQHA